MSNITTIINKNSWKIFLDNEEILNNQDYLSLYKTWSNVFKSTAKLTSNNILCINDKFQIFANSFNYPAKITVVDPLAYEFCQQDVQQLLSTKSFYNIKDSLGFQRTLSLIDTTYKEAVLDGCFNSYYNYICVNVEQPEDISLEIVEQFFLKLEDFGMLLIHIPSSLYNDFIYTNLNHYFSLLTTKYRTNVLNNEMYVAITFIKIPGLI